MQKRTYIIHGWGGFPEEGWFPWLKKELEKNGFRVEVPAMPDSENPKIENWVPFLSQLVGDPDENTFFLGHSIGVQTILRYLESLSENKRVGGAVLVAGWLMRLTGDLGEEEIKIAKPWIETPIDYEKVKRTCPKISAIFSDNDPYVHPDNVKLFEEKLGAKTILEHGKNHFSGSDGVTELPSALGALLEM
jgi:hypothetical protein